MTIIDALILITLAGLLGSAVYTDLRYGKIYNKITMPCILIGLMLNTADGGTSGMLTSLAGIGLALGVYIVLAPLAGIGGGDVKLLMGIGALLGMSIAAWSLAITAIIGGVMALLVMARRRVVHETVRNLVGNLYMGAVLRVPTDPFAGSKRMRFAYSPAIALGTLATLVVRHRFW